MPSIIETIARDLDISSASVSRALNDKPGVGSELRQKILDRARELNYTPSVVGRALASQRTFTIGFFVAEKPGLTTHNDPFYGEILHGAEQAVGSTDYHVTIATLSQDVFNEPQQFRFVREQRIDGMILAGPDIPTDFIMAMIQTDLPVVLVDNKLPFTPVTAVMGDDDSGAYLAARHLIELGHQHIGILTGPQEWSSNARRLSGYLRALNEAGTQYHVIHAERTDMDSGKAAYASLIDAMPDVTGICAVNDSMAIGAIHAAQNQGRHIPDDLSVIGFDDIAWATLNNPPLTTISIPKGQLGREAAKRLLAHLDDPQQAAVEMVVGVQLITRASTKTKA